MKATRSRTGKDQLQEYLKNIFRLQQVSSPVSTSALAEAMEVAPSTVTDMLKKLAQKKFINYKPYHGITLTSEGEKVAIKSIRRHRITERFLTDMLGFEWHEAHEEALNFEGNISDEVERRLYVALHQPKDCPHGYPIPSKVEDVLVDEVALYSMDPGESAQVISVRDDEPELLQFMASLGIKPGVRIKIEGKDPFKGPMQVMVGKKKRIVGWHMANSIFVKKTSRSHTP
jgi:DtxR family transcriptional regulator, Mn-dependent transcriptional regulator